MSNFSSASPTFPHVKTFYPYKEKKNKIKPTQDEILNNVKFSVFFQFMKDKDGKDTNQLCYGVKLKEKGGSLSNELKNANEAFHLDELYSLQEVEIDDIRIRYNNYCKPKIQDILNIILFQQKSLSKFNPKDQKEIISDIVKAYSKRMKRMILGLPLGAKGKQYPFKKFKEDFIEQIEKKR